MSTNALELLKKHTIVVADTGDIEAIKVLKPVDATTNPSLILQVASKAEYAGIVDAVIAQIKADATIPAEQKLDAAMDALLVKFGTEILQHVPGVVSSEVDARLSYDTAATVEKAKKVIALYEQAGVAKDRVLIKIASTWEGIKAAEILEHEYGIKTNLTLLFSQAQARACAEAQVTLISPFVGRILDFFKAKGNTYDDAAQDPGVVFVSGVYKWYKTYGYNTIVMGASFRNIQEIIELCGCDKLTISPGLLNQLADLKVDDLEKKLDADKVEKAAEKLPKLTHAQYLWQHNADPMAVEKLASGIVAFANDIEKLEKIVQQKLE